MCTQSQLKNNKNCTTRLTFDEPKTDALIFLFWMATGPGRDSGPALIENSDIVHQKHWRSQLSGEGKSISSYRSHGTCDTYKANV